MAFTQSAAPPRFRLSEPKLVAKDVRLVLTASVEKVTGHMIAQFAHRRPERSPSMQEPRERDWTEFVLFPDQPIV